MPSKLVTSSASSLRLSSRLTRVSPRWLATAVEAVVVTAVAVVVGVVVAEVEVEEAGLAATPLLSVAVAGGKQL